VRILAGPPFDGVPVAVGVDGVVVAVCGVGLFGVLPDVVGGSLTTGVLLTTGLDGVWDDGAVGAGAVLAVGVLDTRAEGLSETGVDTVGVPGLLTLREQAQRRSVSVTASSRTSDFLTLYVYFIATSPCIIYS